MINLFEALGAALSSATSILELSTDIKNSDFQRRIAELNVQLADVKNGVAGLQNENNELRKELAGLKEDQSHPLVFNQADGLYYNNDEPAPYCPHCYETQKARVHLIKATGRCPACKESFYGKHVGIASIPPPPSRWKIN
ncbi:MAG: hypothetical protein LBU16_10415 [Treponema sp.]|nr:hypothetical protein [Treponema sp.]